MEHFWQSKNPHTCVFRDLTRLASEIKTREAQWTKWTSIFLNEPLAGLKLDQFSRAASYKAMLDNAACEEPLVLNPARNCIKSLAARIASQRPTAKFTASTDGPNGWSIKQRAKGLTKFVRGEWHRSKFHQQAIKVFLHGAVLGIGAMHIYPGYKHVEFEVVAPWELIVDEQAAMDGVARQLYRVKHVPAEKLQARFCGSHVDARYRKSNQQAIDSAKTRAVDYGTTHKTTTDLVRVVEAWHLPSGWGAHDGYHVICVEDATLTPPKERDWSYDHFPFAFFRWNEPLIGWYPQGLIEESAPIQTQQNKLLARIQRAMDLYSNANTFVEEGTIEESHLTNTSGNIIPVKAHAKFMPKTMMPNSISSEIYRFVWDLNRTVYRETGVSELSASSIKPPGIESGRGLMELKDTESGRHALTNLGWDDFYLMAAELTVCAARAMHARDGEYKTLVKTKKTISTLNWKDVDLDRDSHIIQVFPSSSLPHEPSGRLQQVENLLAAGFIDKGQALSLLRFPDLEQFYSLETAAAEDIEHQIEKMLVDGEEQRPEPYMDLGLGLRMMTSALLRAANQGAPMDNIQLVMAWIEEADRMLEEAAQREAVVTQAQQQNPGPQGLPPNMQAAMALPPQGV